MLFERPIPAKNLFPVVSVSVFIKAVAITSFETPSSSKEVAIALSCVRNISFAAAVCVSITVKTIRKSRGTRAAMKMQYQRLYLSCNRLIRPPLSTDSQILGLSINALDVMGLFLLFHAAAAHRRKGCCCLHNLLCCPIARLK